LQIYALTHIITAGIVLHFKIFFFKIATFIFGHIVFSITYELKIN